MYNDHVQYENEVLKRLFGSEIPDINELRKNIRMVFLNVHPIWDFNRPVPPNVIYLGQMHLQKERVKKLPEEIELFVNSSVHGFIYMSFGSNVKLSSLPQEKIQIFSKIFSEIPYEVLWKRDGEIPVNLSQNIKISEWFPQSTLLRHPKIKLFITQGGLQSTDEAIFAGVPLIVVPCLGDQWYNAEQYVRHGIGRKLELNNLNEKLLKESIEDVIHNKSYRENVKKLRQIITDQPQTSLEKAVWWTEYVLRHKGAKHLMSPAANLSWLEYYEINFVIFLLGILFLCIISIIFILRLLVTFLFVRDIKIKEN
ncbi:UDP-glycosyltransferase UGT33B11 [Danaus plexippus plexippus]|uniref:UDP-glucuronosyltransferase n=1 Tax=Danaus plexippus plexippus TaxID=278856 RepID=A0A212EUM9_DANPL|nr:UDP-glycosyltransferase UGT33B11 [Danaus plexippus plexippus]